MLLQSGLSFAAAINEVPFKETKKLISSIKFKENISKFAHFNMSLILCTKNLINFHNITKRTSIRDPFCNLGTF